MSSHLLWSIAGGITTLFFIIGFFSAIRAVLKTRTPQGAIAWAMALITIPLLAVPFYWTVGRSRIQAKIRYRRGESARLDSLVSSINSKIKDVKVKEAPPHANLNVLNSLSYQPILTGNQTTLLIDGPKTFEAIFESIDQAEKYVLIEFYTIHDDHLGREMKTKLIEAKNRGCRVYVLYDDLGSSNMTSDYLSSLEEAKISVTSLNSRKGFKKFTQINFRNHRKIVVIDGLHAFIGGLNVGDEYVHKDPKYSPWRDTHLKITGPSALSAQFTFVEDWNWATGEILDLDWEPQKQSSDHEKSVFILSSGPDDTYETCGLFFMHCINSAKDRIWIASPYFVPDEAVLAALRLAAMRGVDVRILFPETSDSWIVKNAALAYIPEVTEAGVKFFYYQKGFMHQKVLLIDNEVSVIGTANFDNRSFRLNFEVNAVVYDTAFAKEVEAMLEEDLKHSQEIDEEIFNDQPLWKQARCKLARLFAPIL